MINEDLFIKNIHSKNQDGISVALVYDTLSKEAHRGCGLYYEIYESCFIGLLRDHLSELNEADANKLTRYAEIKARKLMMCPTVKHWKLKGSAELKYTASRCNHTKQKCIVQYTD